jgi:quercetin dioxygenase-like cupin family protein
MDTDTRIFSVEDYIRPADGEPFRSVVLQTQESAIVVWHVAPGQEIAPHLHPHGQDTWTVIAGEADYYKGDGEIARLRAGEIAVAKLGQVHGARNNGSEPFIFVSVVASGNAGYVLAKK